MTETTSNHIRFRGRSFPILSLELDAPIDGWMKRLDACLELSPAFFSRKSVVIDVSGLELDKPNVIDLVGNLSQRGIRIMALTGVEASWESEELPPILVGPKQVAGEDEGADEPESSTEVSADAASLDPTSEIEGGATTTLAAAQSAPASKSAPLVIEGNVRSGQSIFHEGGDVVVIGSVASGAEVSATGSIHIYGALRGRVMAGRNGGESARLFCRKLEAELVSIAGVYLTAEMIDPAMRGGPVQVWLESDKLKLGKLD